MPRVIASLIAFLIYVAANFFFAPRATLVSAQAAGKQFDNSDGGFVTSVYSMNFLSGVSALLTLALLLALAFIWLKPLRSMFQGRGNGVIAPAIIIAASIVGVRDSRAYYDKSDFTEVYFILPNESAFFIPDAGANKDSQSAFGSEEYLRANKIPAKRFQIPHAKLSGSSTWSDFYVPTGRLVIVDRAPFSREWVAQSTRGTSAKDESFPCQSKEGLNISIGMAIGASVSEENSPKFLYRFGVRPPQGDRTKPEVIFASVFYGRSLTEVMDGPIRNKVQSLVCGEFTKRSFDEGNAQAGEILKSIETNVGAYLANVGITLDFIGWADTFTFDKDVQAAVNRRYVATQDRAIAEALAPYADTIQKLAAAQALRSFGEKSDGRLPSTIVGLPTDIGGLLGGLLRTAPTGAPAPATR